MDKKVIGIVTASLLLALAFLPSAQALFFSDWVQYKGVSTIKGLKYHILVVKHLCSKLNFITEGNTLVKLTNRDVGDTEVYGVFDIPNKKGIVRIFDSCGNRVVIPTL